MTLLDHHLAHLRASGLTDETIAAAGIYSLTDPVQAGALLNWKGPGPAPAIAFPYFDRTGNVVATVLRPDKPHARLNGHAPKYEWKLDAGPRLYYPPPSLVPASALVDPARPLIVIEGIKKLLCAAQAGAIGISAQGTTVWHDIVWREAHRDAPNEWRLHPDLDGIPLVGRSIYVGFDGGDTTHNAHVILAEARLARLLLDAGADARLLRIPAPAGRKAGLDDYLALQHDPRASLAALLGSALKAAPLDRVRALREAHDKAMAALALLRDWSLAASLSVGDGALVDVVASEFQKLARISKKAVQSAIDSFAELLRPRAPALGPVPAAPPTEQQLEVLKEGEALLRDPNLIEQFLLGAAADGLVGEQKTALLLLLAVVSRKMRKPIHVVVKAASSAGKNYVVGIVTKYLPPADLVEISDMSPRALLYMPTSIKGKVLVIAEQEGAERAEYTMRVAMSEGKLSVLVAEKAEGEGGSRVETRQHTVEGPACFITTTTRSLLHDENETRVLELTLDESPEQTRQILHASAMAAERPPTVAAREAAEHRCAVWRAALRALPEREVIIPNARHLASAFPPTKVRARRDFPKLLALIQAHALLHQHQREIVDERVIASDLDVATAKELCASLWSDISPRLDKVARTLQERFKESVFTAPEVAKVLGQNVDAVRRLLRELERLDLVEQMEEGKGKRPGRWRNAPDTSAAVAAEAAS